MTFSDIFKSSFLTNVTSVSLLDMVLALVLAFGVGLFVFFIYKKTYSGVMYSSSFGVTLIALTMITTLVILAVTSNVVLSLGMVGALSIVRFRTGSASSCWYLPITRTAPIPTSLSSPVRGTRARKRQRRILRSRQINASSRARPRGRAVWS